MLGVGGRGGGGAHGRASPPSLLHGIRIQGGSLHDVEGIG